MYLHIDWPTKGQRDRGRRTDIHPKARSCKGIHRKTLLKRSGQTELDSFHWAAGQQKHEEMDEVPKAFVRERVVDVMATQVISWVLSLWKPSVQNKPLSLKELRNVWSKRLLNLKRNIGTIRPITCIFGLMEENAVLRKANRRKEVNILVQSCWGRCWCEGGHSEVWNPLNSTAGRKELTFCWVRWVWHKKSTQITTHSQTCGDGGRFLTSNPQKYLLPLAGAEFQLIYGREKEEK